jgi:hypothetical protein
MQFVFFAKGRLFTFPSVPLRFCSARLEFPVDVFAAATLPEQVEAEERELKQ